MGSEHSDFTSMSSASRFVESCGAGVNLADAPEGFVPLLFETGLIVGTDRPVAGLDEA